MGEAKPKSWTRDLAWAVLLAVLLVGLPAVGVAAAHYRKHIQACYWAWKWARGTRGRAQGGILHMKLMEMRASETVWSLAWRLAYRLADEKNKMDAASMLGLRDIYTLVKEEGTGTDIEQLLKLRIANGVYESLPPEGAEEVYVDSGGPEGKPTRYPRRKFLMRYRFGSYRVWIHTDWEADPNLNPEGTSGQHARPSCVLNSLEGTYWRVQRIPGPWRDLPEPPDDEEHYEKL